MKSLDTGYHIPYEYKMRKGLKWRIWWFFAYKGIYQTNWWLKRKFGNESMTDSELWKSVQKGVKTWIKKLN